VRLLFTLSRSCVQNKKSLCADYVRPSVHLSFHDPVSATKLSVFMKSGFAYTNFNLLGEIRNSGSSYPDVGAVASFIKIGTVDATHWLRESMKY
jgi:hypothetical protein